MPDHPAPTDDPSLVQRTQKDKPIHTTMSSGPAASSVDARKNKKKRNKNQPYIEDPSEPADTNDKQPFMAATPTQPETQATPTPPGTHVSQTPGYPQSERGDTPPPMNLPDLHEDLPPPTPPSPTNYPRTVMNTPIPRRLTELDLDLGTPMDIAPGETQETPVATKRIQPTAPPGTNQKNPPVLNRLGLTTQPGTPQTPPTKTTLFDRLEEAAIGQASTEKHPARNTIEKYHPGPMPPIQDTTPTSLFDNIDLALIKEWDARPGGKLIAVPFDPDVRNIESHDYYRTRLLTAVTEIITTQEASVASPRPSKDAASKNKTPTSFLIYNITDEQADFMLQRKVWSSRTITFRVAPLAVTCPSFLFSIRDLSTVGFKDVYPIVRSVWDSEKMLKFAEDLVEEAPEDQKPKLTQDIKLLLSSMTLGRLDIKEAGNNLCPRFNVYADCNDFTHDKVWLRLRTFLMNAVYTSPMEAIRATTEVIPFKCTCCHGVDHPRGLCPFPSLPGWNGPKRDLPDPFQRRNGGRMSGPPFDRRPQRQRFTPRN